MLLLNNVPATASVGAVAVDGMIRFMRLGLGLLRAGLAFAAAAAFDTGVADDLADRLLDGALGLACASGLAASLAAGCRVVGHAATSLLAASAG
ncbi:hypothetical protein SPHINGOT1_10002 [Sphingomonas sp. T1]|nr:hypothetical protein SPHINGOT1_10002 [Sphingomonas sp. T1]